MNKYINDKYSVVFKQIENNNKVYGVFTISEIPCVNITNFGCENLKVC